MPPMIKFYSGAAQSAGKAAFITVLSTRLRQAPFDGISGIVVAGCRGMARRHETIDERLVLRRERVLERPHIVAPMSLGPRARDGPCHQLVVEHPGDRELACSEATSLGVPLDGLGDAQRLRPPFRLHYALVV